MTAQGPGTDEFGTLTITYIKAGQKATWEFSRVRDFAVQIVPPVDDDDVVWPPLWRPVIDHRTEVDWRVTFRCLPDDDGVTSRLQVDPTGDPGSRTCGEGRAR